MPLPRLPQTDDLSPTVWLWAGHALYVGPSLFLQPHVAAVHVLAVGLTGEFEVRVRGRSRTTRTAFIPPRVTHHIIADGPVAFCYFDAGSRRARACREAMLTDDGPLTVDHRREAEIVAALGDSPVDPTSVLDLVAEVTVVGDERIAHATALLRVHPQHDYSAAEMAAEVHLSTSRFLQLFSAHTGTTFRRYRLWTRMCDVGASIAKGRDLTTAAVEAGFASPSHFSSAFRTMFGLSASMLLESGASIVVDQ